jgi:decaprenylphospho-beta-D-erythro-pentofuranosid-2-ulose 2-reductase
MAERGHDLFLLGRDTADLEKSARDLEVRSGRGPIRTAVCDLSRSDGFASALDAAESALRGLDTVVVTAGLFAPQERLEEDVDLARRVLEVDFTNTVVFCEHARRRLLARGGGTLCVFSSVAGERGRKPVVLYGAAKAGLSRYLEGLDHRFRSQGLRTVCVKPGFVRTSMTDGLPTPPFAGQPEKVAPAVLRAIERGQPVVYVPGTWRWVMLVIRMLPRAVMRRVRF